MDDTLAFLDQRIQSLEQKVSNMMLYGIVADVNHVYTSVIVDFKNGAFSPSLPFLQQPNNWNPVKIGDQVVVFSPNGNIQHGFVIPKIYLTGQAPDIAPDSFVIKFDYGKIVFKEGNLLLETSANMLIQNKVNEKITNSILCENGNITMDVSSKIVLQNRSGDITDPEKNIIGSITCEEGLITIDSESKIVLQNRYEGTQGTEILGSITCENGEIVLDTDSKVLIQNKYEEDGNDVISNITCEYGEVTIDANKKITLQRKNGETVTDSIICEEGNITLNSSGNIVLQGESGGGVVCKNHICSFTGSPHPQASSKVKGIL